MTDSFSKNAAMLERIKVGDHIVVAYDYESYKDAKSFSGAVTKIDDTHVYLQVGNA